MTANPSILSKRDNSTPRDSNRKQHKKPRLSLCIYEQRHTCEESHQSGPFQKLCQAVQASYHPQWRTTSSPNSPDQLQITRERESHIGCRRKPRSDTQESGLPRNGGRETKTYGLEDHPQRRHDQAKQESICIRYSGAAKYLEDPENTRNGGLGIEAIKSSTAPET